MNRFSPRTIMAAIAEPESRAQPSLDRAAQLAIAFGAELVLFHTAFESALSGRPFFDSKRLARARGWRLDERKRALERHAGKLSGQGVKVSTLAAWEEPAHEAIVRAAIRERAELIVAGPHVSGRANAPFSLRQTEWSLLRLCPQPLLLVRSGARERGPVLAALDPLHLNDKPAALDQALARTAAAVAEKLEAPFHVAHSVAPSLYAVDGDIERLRNEMSTQASAAMQRTLARAGAEAGRISIVEGLPETALPRLAKKLRAQLLVMGAVSRRGLQRYVIGDTAERMIDAAPCDLLIVKPAGFKPKFGRARKQTVLLPRTRNT